MVEASGVGVPAEAAPLNRRLAILLAMAMFVLVVDTSIMNVSMSAVVTDLGTTVSGVQSAIALEALVLAAFILIGSKVGDLIGRKRAYVLGLCGYDIGALAMTLAQTLLAVIIFWAVVGGIGASLLLPAMQSLIHGNFEGSAQKKVYAMVGAAATVAAAVGPLLGGFITTYLSWRVAFGLEIVVIAVAATWLGVTLVGSTLTVVGYFDGNPIPASVFHSYVKTLLVGLVVWALVVTTVSRPAGLRARDVTFVGGAGLVGYPLYLLLLSLLQGRPLVPDLWLVVNVIAFAAGLTVGLWATRPTQPNTLEEPVAPAG
jgi:MFS family permease